MPRIKYSPQFSTRRIAYDLAGELLTAKLETGEQDVFDFSGLPNGRAQEIETILPVQPVVRAERIDGELQLELLKFIGLDASQAERFPEWMEATNGAY
jgi:hypothetical protein